MKNTTMWLLLLRKPFSKSPTWALTENFWSSSEPVTSRVIGSSSGWRMLLNVYIYIFDLFSLSSKNVVFINVIFIIFISFLVEVSNFRNKIWTNQKSELVMRNCHWNCISGLKNFMFLVASQLWPHITRTQKYFH